MLLVFKVYNISFTERECHRNCMDQAPFPTRYSELPLRLSVIKKERSIQRTRDDVL